MNMDPSYFFMTLVYNVVCASVQVRFPKKYIVPLNSVDHQFPTFRCIKSIF